MINQKKINYIFFNKLLAYSLRQRFLKKIVVAPQSASRLIQLSIIRLAYIHKSEKLKQFKCKLQCTLLTTEI